MPKYSSTNISGDAAEYLVAYAVTHKLRWPCRLLDVDIGVDGEMEVLDESGESNGDVIKFQVKAVAEMSPIDTHVYVDEQHIKYWKNFSAPIIVCCVAHSTATIYWQSIFQTEAYLSSGEARRITFNSAHSLLDASSKNALCELVTPQAAKDFSAELGTLKAYINRWKGVGGITTGYSDGGYLDEVEKEADAINKLVVKLVEGRRIFPWRFSPLDLQVMEAGLDMAKWVKRLVHQASVDSYY